MTKTTIKLSPRSKMRLTAEEKVQLNEYVNDNPTAYKDINLNTSIHRATVVLTMKRGWIELEPGIKLRDFLKALKLQTI